MPIFGPVNQYTNVHVYDITAGGGGNMIPNGTGTLSSDQTVFSCGTFSADNLPNTAHLFRITADLAGANYVEAPLKCVHSGATSDFKA